MNSASAIKGCGDFQGGGGGWRLDNIVQVASLLILLG
jgi:hypothetical protein